MSSILELPEVRARVGLLSVEAYEMLAEAGAVKRNAELIRGVILEKMPKSPLHCTLVMRVFLFLLSFRRRGLLVFTERPLRLAGSMPEPGVMMVNGKSGDFEAEHPTSAQLVVEVAISSVALDREKALLYAEADVPEYWIVLGQEQQIEVYRQPLNGVYQQQQSYGMDETLICGSVPGLEVPVTAWFIEREDD